MATLNALIVGNIAGTNIGGAAGTLANVAKDFLSISGMAQKRRAQQTAFTNPQLYIQSRNAEITALEDRIATNWANNLTRYNQIGVNAGTALAVQPLPEALAKERATTESLAEFQAGMLHIDQIYPLQAITTAVQRQHNQNARVIADGAEITGVRLQRKRAPAKKRGRPRKA